MDEDKKLTWEEACELFPELRTAKPNPIFGRMLAHMEKMTEEEIDEMFKPIDDWLRSKL